MGLGASGKKGLLAWLVETIPPYVTVVHDRMPRAGSVVQRGPSVPPLRRYLPYPKRIFLSSPPLSKPSVEERPEAEIAMIWSSFLTCRS